MTRTLLILIAMCLGAVYGQNYAQRRVFHDDVFGDATVSEVQQANNVWSEK